MTAPKKPQLIRLSPEEQFAFQQASKLAVAMLNKIDRSPRSLAAGVIAAEAVAHIQMRTVVEEGVSEESLLRLGHIGHELAHQLLEQNGLATPRTGARSGCACGTGEKGDVFADETYTPAQRKQARKAAKAALATIQGTEPAPSAPIKKPGVGHAPGHE